MAIKPQNQTATQRPKRTPVGGPRSILDVKNQDPNYVYRWVNSSIVGRVERFKEAGYEIVPNEEVEVGDRVVDRGSNLGSARTRSGGGGVVLVLMRIPKEWYDEDQAAKQADIDTLEESMMADARAGTYGSINLHKANKV